MKFLSARACVAALGMAVLALLLPSPSTAGESIPVATVRLERMAPFLEHGETTAPGRDPFNWSREQINYFKSRSPREASNSIAGLTLTGILWDDKKPLAIINNAIAGVGDTVNDSVIKEVRRDLVIIEQAGIRYTLWLEPVLTKMAPGKPKR